MCNISKHNRFYKMLLDHFACFGLMLGLDLKDCLTFGCFVECLQSTIVTIMTINIEFVEVKLPGLLLGLCRSDFVPNENDGVFVTSILWYAPGAKVYFSHYKSI